MATKRPFLVLRILRLIALAATLSGGFSLVSTAIFYKSALPAQGIILDWVSTNEAFTTGRAPLIAFIDHRNQKQFAAPQSAAGTVNDLLGQKLRIRYTPGNPEIFRIDTLMGMWGSPVLRLLYGLIPYLFLSRFMAAPRKDAPARRKKRKSTLNVSHLVDHTQSLTDTDRPAVRRMRTLTR